MTNLQERLRSQFADPLPRGVITNISRLCKVSKPSVSAWFRNPEKVSSISRTHAEIICNEYKLSVSPVWLSEGTPPKYLHEPQTVHQGVDALPPEPSNIEPGPDNLRRPVRLPVVGDVKAGPDGYLEERQYPVGHGEGYVEYWTSDSNAYALRVKGDSMHPRYRAGEFVVVTPSIEAQPGNDVVVCLGEGAHKDGVKLLKQLNWKRGHEVQLLSINNGYEPMTIDAASVLSIQRVAGSVPSDAFMVE